jgi:hypothetical protein
MCVSVSVKTQGLFILMPIGTTALEISAILPTFYIYNNMVEVSFSGIS